MLYRTAFKPLPSSAFETLITVRNSRGPCNVPCQVPVKSCASSEPVDSNPRTPIHISSFFIAPSDPDYSTPILHPTRIRQRSLQYRAPHRQPSTLRRWRRPLFPPLCGTDLRELCVLHFGS